MMGYDFSNLSKVEPLKKLMAGFKRDKGRNNQGRITTRHRGGGAKRLYRFVDFKQEKMNVPAKVFSMEYDPEPHGENCEIALCRRRKKIHFSAGRPESRRRDYRFRKSQA